MPRTRAGDSSEMILAKLQKRVREMPGFGIPAMRFVHANCGAIISDDGSFAILRRGLSVDPKLTRRSVDAQLETFGFTPVWTVRGGVVVSDTTEYAANVFKELERRGLVTIKVTGRHEAAPDYRVTESEVQLTDKGRSAVAKALREERLALTRELRSLSRPSSG